MVGQHPFATVNGNSFHKGVVEQGYTRKVDLSRASWPKTPPLTDDGYDFELFNKLWLMLCPIEIAFIHHGISWSWIKGCLRGTWVSSSFLEDLMKYLSLPESRRARTLAMARAPRICQSCRGVAVLDRDIRVPFFGWQGGFRNVIWTNRTTVPKIIEKQGMSTFNSRNDKVGYHLQQQFVGAFQQWQAGMACGYHAQERRRRWPDSNSRRWASLSTMFYTNQDFEGFCPSTLCLEAPTTTCGGVCWWCNFLRSFAPAKRVVIFFLDQSVVLNVQKPGGFASNFSQFSLQTSPGRVIRIWTSDAQMKNSSWCVL